MTGSDSKNWAALGRQVKARREQLRLKQQELGPSDLTIRKLEQGTGKDLRARTLQQIEQALEWKPGLIDAILDGSATDAEIAERWVIADSEGATRVKVDSDGRFQGRVVPVPDAVDDPGLSHGDAAARLAVELLGALAVQPTRNEAEQELAEHLHRFIGARLTPG